MLDLRSSLVFFAVYALILLPRRQTPFENAPGSGGFRSRVECHFRAKGVSFDLNAFLGKIRFAGCEAARRQEVEWRGEGGGGEGYRRLPVTADAWLNALLGLERFTGWV